MHPKSLFAVAGLLFCGLFGVTSAPAYAGLVGNTVSAVFWVPSTTAPPPLACAVVGMDNCEDETPAVSPPTVPTDFLEGALSLSTISVGDTQITITNFGDPVTQPFCSTLDPCHDAFTGFVFIFSSGADITSVTVDPSTPADFFPISGGLTFTSTAIFVNLAGQAPDVGDKLILDVTAGSAPVVPEPSTWTMMLLGFAGLGFAGYRRMGGHGGTTRAG